ncbi:MAG: polyprenyl synthetase family protein [Solirubrobacterales bacterium]
MDVSAYPDHLRKEVDRALRDLPLSPRDATRGLDDAMRYSLTAGGKRIRPVLCLATAQTVGLEWDDALPIALALELIHTYSLIHDDLPAMDDDDLRRGRPTCHVAFGEDVAILAGDGLFAEAVALLLAPGDDAGAPDRLAAAREVVTATGVEGMVGGQYMDVVGEQRTKDGLRELHRLKTGRLIAASVTAPLLAARAPEAARIPLRRFATELGVLFQIVDDILDVTGTDEQLGKPQGSDERHGKWTYVSAFGIEEARGFAGSAHAAARSHLGEVPGDTATLHAITDFIATRSS